MQRVLSNNTPMLSGYPSNSLFEAALAGVPNVAPKLAAPNQPRNFLRDIDINLPQLFSR
jgi:hypothetical protein